MTNKKHIIAIDFILVVGTLFALFFIIGYARPMVIAPIDGLETTNGSVLFSFENGEKILIDDNIEFTSPIVINVEDNIEISLEPGEYYWKVEGLVDSEVRKLTVNSLIDLRVKKSGGGYDLVNSGNTRLNVDIYEEGKLTGNIVLDKDEEEKAEGSYFVGREDG